MRRIPVSILALLTSFLSLPVLAADWKMVFHNNFEREELGPDWVVGDYGFIEDGKLYEGNKQAGLNIMQ